MKDRLRELRKTLGLKQREMKERLGVSGAAYGAWETGADSIPNVRIYQICKEFGVNENWLKNGVGDMFIKGATKEEKLKDAFKLVFDSLTDEGKEALKEAIKEATNEQSY